MAEIRNKKIKQVALKEQENSSNLLPKNLSKAKEFLKISEGKKCTGLHSVRIKKKNKAEIYYDNRHGNPNYSNEESTRLSNDAIKAETLYSNHCGKKLRKILFEIHPTFKKAYQNNETALKKVLEKLDIVFNCLEIERL